MAELLVCGVDEAGRGPLAGPVYAAAVILDSGRPISGLRDSKKLSEKKRLYLAEAIRENALAWAVAHAEVTEIDTINILQASLLAMQRAVEALNVQPDMALIDGLHCPSLQIPAEAIVKGDDKVAQIAAASILAKTARDKEMLVLHREYPQYGFDRHKGYGTAIHLAAIRVHGACPAHRLSFAPLRTMGLKS
jgi:ribonuclease HII